MTRDELLAQLREIATLTDPERAHGMADSALLKFINDPEIEAAYDAIEMWYS